MFGHQDNDVDNQDHNDNQSLATNSQQAAAPANAADFHSATSPSPPVTPLLMATAMDEHADTNVSTPPPDLASLKVQALGKLYPLVHKLDLSPEENFRTIMMMIQATDNKDLIQSAYEAANKIEDEHAKAKALLDVVNEINYFTNQPGAN